MKNVSKVYFPNLNGLRFLAAILVVICHIEQFKNIKNLPNIWLESEPIRRLGEMGVILFFVLSGFLITYLLLAEESKTNNINIIKFYIRRALRIWPLYFLIVGLAFFVLPYITEMVWPGKSFGAEKALNGRLMKVIYFMAFLPNLGLATFGMVPYASHLWSIGTEEQFYLFWPVLLKVFKNNKIKVLLAIAILFPIILYFLQNYYYQESNYKIFIKYLEFFNIDSMAIGGILSFLHFKKSLFLENFKNSKIFYISLILVTLGLLFGVKIRYIDHQIYSILFAIIILNLSTNKNLPFSLENKTFTYLGNISYGIYMWHPIAIFFTLHLALVLGQINNIFIYVLSIVFSISLAAISYELMEKQFLKLKDKFTIIASGNNKL